MVCKVVMTRRGQALLDDCVLYILLEKLNEQAAKALVKDAILRRKKVELILKNEA